MMNKKGDFMPGIKEGFQYNQCAARFSWVKNKIEKQVIENSEEREVGDTWTLPQGLAQCVRVPCHKASGSVHSMLFPNPMFSFLVPSALLMTCTIS